jgi:hypothetical protein
VHAAAVLGAEVMLILFQAMQLRLVATVVRSSKDRINGIVSLKKIQTLEDVLLVQSFVHTPHVFETELLAQLQDWKQLLQIISVRCACYLFVLFLD